MTAEADEGLRLVDDEQYRLLFPDIAYLNQQPSSEIEAIISGLEDAGNRGDDAALDHFAEELVQHYLAWKIEASTDYRWYRARVCSEGEYSHLTELGPPPPDRTTAGRANLSGQPVLYLASTPDTAVREVRAVEGDRVAVLQYQVSAPLRLIDVGYVERCSVGREQLASESATRLENLFYLGLNANGWRNQHCLSEYLANLFTRDSRDRAETDFAISSRLASALLLQGRQYRRLRASQSTEVDGLVYPSVSFLRHGYCVAVRETAWPKLLPLRVAEFKVIDVTEIFPFACLASYRTSDVAGDEIQWAPCHESGHPILESFGPPLTRPISDYVGVMERGEGFSLFRRF